MEYMFNINTSSYFKVVEWRLIDQATSSVQQSIDITIQWLEFLPPIRVAPSSNAAHVID
jgi:hypothetical protein